MRKKLGFIGRQFFIALLFISFLAGCDKQNENPPSQKEEILKLMKANGFTEMNSLKARKPAMTLISVKTIEEAEAYIKMIKEVNNHISHLTIGEQNANGRLPACDEPGTYYIRRAITGIPGVTSVEVRYERAANGEIINIVSYVVGLPVVGWDHLGAHVFNPHSEFCIDGIMTYGFDVQGIPLGWRAAVGLRIKLNAGDCGVTITSRYGHC